MAENTADSTEVRMRGKARRLSSPSPKHRFLSRSNSKCRTTFLVPSASLGLCCCCDFLYACRVPPLSPSPFSLGRELCTPLNSAVPRAASRKPPLSGWFP